MKNKIGWCNLTWNPVWGCRNNCPYCYARSIAKRFGKERAEDECHYCYKNNIGTNPYTKRAFIKCTEKLRNFKPTFLESQFNKRFPQKTQKIFVGSMSEIAHWRKEWVEKVIEKVKQYPQHIFQFLTRYPEVYLKHNFPENCWLGITITKDGDLDEDDLECYDLFFNLDRIKYLSLEPLLDEIPLLFLEGFDWVIIGAETGNRKGKIIPKKDWIKNIVNYCEWNNIPVYLKDSLKEIYPEKIKMFP